MILTTALFERHDVDVSMLCSFCLFLRAVASDMRPSKTLNRDATCNSNFTRSCSFSYSCLNY